MDNRTRFKQLLDQYGIPQASKDNLSAAKIIAAVTKVPCSDRAVRSWLNDPTKSSSRPCPDWALTALQTGIGYMQRAVEPPADQA
jgi:hypothetical protein